MAADPRTAGDAAGRQALAATPRQDRAGCIGGLRGKPRSIASARGAAAAVPSPRVDFPVANGGAAVGSFSVDDVVEIRAHAIAPVGTQSPGTPTITLTALSGGAFIQISTGNDPARAKLQIYRSTSATPDRAADGVGAPWLFDPGGSGAADRVDRRHGIGAWILCRIERSGQPGRVCRGHQALADRTVGHLGQAHRYTTDTTARDWRQGLGPQFRHLGRPAGALFCLDPPGFGSERD